MKNIILTIIFITFSNSTIFGQENSIVKIIDENAFEIQETNPEIEFNKSDKLDSIFENVRIFGFGEATHGTKEFFDLKIKFFKYLVKNQGSHSNQ